jgi:hypothetical protein
VSYTQYLSGHNPTIRMWDELGYKKLNSEGFQDGDYREEAESMPPKVKSWRDAGDTPYRKNHREEAKL